LTLSDIHSLARSHGTQGKYITKRVVYLIKEEDVIVMTAQLDSLNSSMSKLLTNTSIIHQQKNVQQSRIIPNEREATAIASLLKQVQGYTDRLFQAFRSTWVPGCHRSHDVALFLDTPVLPISDYRSSSIQSFKFRVMLSRKPLDITLPSSWHEANVTVFEEDSIMMQPS
jgi:hypothetical protein